MSTGIMVQLAGDDVYAVETDNGELFLATNHRFHNPFRGLGSQESWFVVKADGTLVKTLKHLDQNTTRSEDVGPAYAIGSEVAFVALRMDQLSTTADGHVSVVVADGKGSKEATLELPAGCVGVAAELEPASSS